MDKVNKMSRFYKTADIVEEASAWGVLLDGRKIKTPAKAALSVPSEALAKALADEWNGQEETIDLAAMTLTRLANVAIDRTPDTRVELAGELSRYASTDVTCYLAERPSELRTRQDKAWAPWRRWAGERLDVVLVPVEGLIASPQPATSLEAISSYALEQNNFRLTGLAWAASLFSSAVLALAVSEGALDASEAFKLSALEEDWQIEQWGEDEEAALARAGRARDAAALGVWFSSLR